MKPFNLEEAKAGNSVMCSWTSGEMHEARIICYEFEKSAGMKFIVAIVRYHESDTDHLLTFKLNGEPLWDFSLPGAGPRCLFMKPIKRVGYVAKQTDARNICSCKIYDNIGDLYADLTGPEGLKEDGISAHEIEWEE